MFDEAIEAACKAWWDSSKSSPGCYDWERLVQFGDSRALTIRRAMRTALMAALDKMAEMLLSDGEEGAGE